MQTIAAFKNAGEEKILSLLPLAWHPLAGGGEISPAIQSKNPHIQAESEGGRGCALWSLSVFHIYCRIQQVDNVMVAWECLLGGVWFICKCLGCCHIPGFLCTSFPCFPPSFLLFAGYGGGSDTRKAKRGIPGWGEMHRLLSTGIVGNCLGLRVWNQVVRWAPGWFMPLGQTALSRFTYPTSGYVKVLLFVLSRLQMPVEWCLQKRSYFLRILTVCLLRMHKSLHLNS